MTQPQTAPRVIARFRGEWAFLSSMHQSPILSEGITYPSGEHLFHALKTRDPEERQRIALARTSLDAKRIGRTVTLIPGWDEWRRYDAMEYVLALKFAFRTTLAERLTATGGSVLIEGNTWHDNTWGVCSCGKCTNGHNLLGWMLMRQRGRLS